MFEDMNINIEAMGHEEEPEFMPLFSLEDDEDEKFDDEFPSVLPILALKNTILFPRIVIPITVGREKSIQAIQSAYDTNRLIAVLSQEDSRVENPTINRIIKESVQSALRRNIRRILRLHGYPADLQKKR
jgi:ATP-dependent Lon protease